MRQPARAAEDVRIVEPTKHSARRAPSRDKLADRFAAQFAGCVRYEPALRQWHVRADHGLGLTAFKRHLADLQRDGWVSAHDDSLILNINESGEQIGDMP